MDLAAELERRLAAKENRKNRRNKKDRRSMADTPDQTERKDITGSLESSGTQDMTDSITEALRREVEGNIPAEGEGKPKKGKRHAKANTNKGRRLRIAAFCAAAAVLAAVAIPFAGRLREDADAQKLSEEVLSREELRAELQRQADSSRFRVVLNTAPVSGDGKTADWCVANSASNSYDMQVIIQTEDSKELYRSGLISPGAEELEGELATPLEPGTYPAVAVVYAFDRETGEEAGEVTVDLTLTVGAGQPETEMP